ncbi:ComEC/Rec2 family competence protein, partial [Streptomyces sparsus]
AGAGVAALHTAAVRSGPLPALADRQARVTAELTLTKDPRLAAPRPHGGPRPVMLTGRVTRVVTTDGRETKVRSPVLVIVPAPHPDPWLALLPSSQLRVKARAVPPLDGRGGEFTAVLRADASAPPHLLSGPDTAQRIAGRLRAGLRTATDGLPEDPRAMLPALVVGDTSRLTPELRAAVQAVDMTHLLVVSGAHLSIILMVLIGTPHTASRAERGGLAALLRMPLRTTAILGGVLVLGFITLCRPGPSVLRASVCGGIALLAIATGRRRSLLPALAAAVLLLVLLDPTLARSFGFLLSVLATGALLTLAPRWSRALQRRRVPLRLAEALSAAAAAQLVCAPVVTVFAARVSLVAVPANLLAQLAFAPATLLGWAALAAAPVAMPVAVGL